MIELIKVELAKAGQEMKPEIAFVDVMAALVRSRVIQIAKRQL